MSEPPVLFRAEVYAGDARTTTFLGGLDVRGPRRALRFLRRQAHRFADALDPSPFTEWVPAQALRPAAPTERDAPAELRRWAEDLAHQDAALRQLVAGGTFAFTARDDLCWYVLTAHGLRRPAHGGAG
ncbi:hypothetical protein [Streptomyces sp. NPDC088785]|uniref:hypothetical protein n=1 Tax=Streptomyces sp. NPDC088785 TaxID=3365897 RepID=UPI003800964B